MKHLSNIVPYMKYTWSFSMAFVTYMLFRNMFTANSYLWWPFKHWIQDHTFESVIVLSLIGYLMSLRCRKRS
ncbi:MAG: hypothetical protein Unbinned4409contig1002_5 [Prokaryotic dsDNA virus sp.]|nr:MAG: hypothetical protein Unbinned4409contig1002_5 [Prokaryotic dsDNA virus sp.]